MTQSNSYELPKHVVAKIEKVLGVLPAELDGYDFVQLIEELCDTALMFDQKERGSARAGQQPSQGEAVDTSPTTQRQRRKHHVPEGGGPGGHHGTHDQ